MKFQIDPEFERELNHEHTLADQGREVFGEGRVALKDLDYDNQILSFSVTGSVPYDVRLFFTNRGEIFEGECTCSAFHKYEGCCKHIYGSALASTDIELDRFQFIGNRVRMDRVGQTEEKHQKKLSTERNRLMFDLLGQSRTTRLKMPVRLELSLFRDQYYSNTVFSIELRIGDEKFYKIPAISSFLDSYNQERSVDFGKYFTYNPWKHEFPAEERELLELMAEIRTQEMIGGRGGYYPGGAKGMFQGKKMYISQRLVKKVLQLYQKKEFFLFMDKKMYAVSSIQQGKIPMEFLLEKDGEQYKLVAPEYGLSSQVTSDGEYMIFGNQLYHLSREQMDTFFPVYHRFEQEGKNAIFFDGKEKSTFMTIALPKIKSACGVTLDEHIEDEIVEGPLKTKIYFNKAGYGISAKVIFDYGIEEIPAYGGNTLALDEKGERTGRVLIRKLEEENGLLGKMEELGFRRTDALLYLEEEEDVFHFLNNGLGELQQQAELYYSEDFKNIVQGTGKPFRIRVKLEENDLLAFTFQHEDISQREIRELLRAIKYKKKYFRLKNGSFLSLGSQELKTVAELVEELDIRLSDFDQGQISLPKYRAFYLDAKLRELGKTKVEQNRAFQQFVKSIKEPVKQDYEVPAEINGVLREYQKTGYRWLKALAEYGLGGILADDMGLGKTLQTIAFIQSLPAGSKTLIVAPTSLIFNWQEETLKFAPNLKVLVVNGTPTERKAALREVDKYDMVITSYPVLRRDIALFEKKTFQYCFADEAQHIKNPHSMNAKTLKKIKAKGRFALTGTPIENSLTELWSIFDFVMPGYLYKHETFLEKIEKPAVREQDSKAMEHLRQMVRPFLLRRIKKDVLKELPEKIETRLMTDLTEKQKTTYLAYLAKAREDVAAAIGEGGFQKSRVKILSILTRLRQICCHPALFLEDYKGDSGKLELLEELLMDAVEGGHRLLIFSQFTGMLALIRRRLEERNLTYLYLDGQTKAEERSKLVKQFNEGQGTAFLISLKAGGTGLNLTGADMVVHVDPWWNPAVEDQATDRAHRIGQNKVVQVFRLITKGTIEEKVMELQQRKKDLTDAVIEPGETFLSKLSETELLSLFEG